MNTLLWIVQVLLIALFLGTGLLKLSRPKEELAEPLPWVEDFTAGQVRLIAILEILGALGLLLPGLTGVAPVLVSLAAIGLAFLMVGAMVTHFRRAEYATAAVNAVVLIAALFVAYGRFFVAPL